MYEPTPVSWTNYYEEPTVPLFSYDYSTNSYIQEEEPSPYLDYYFYHEPTASYVYYQPSVASWSDYYETPTLPLFEYSEAENSYKVAPEELTPISDYFYWSEPTQDYLSY
jgi:hypothetical protein